MGKKTGQTKRLLKFLGTDDCCIECPTLSPDAGNALECRSNGLFVPIPEDNGGELMRFGVEGEDDTAAESRAFVSGLNSFEILQNLDYDSYFGFYGDSIDMYLQSPGLDDYVELFLEPGFIGIYLDDDSELYMFGIDAGVATNGLLGLDNNSKVVRVVGDPNRFVVSNSSDAMNSSGLNPVPSLILSNVALGYYEVNINLSILISNDGSTGLSAQLAFTGGVGNQRQVYRVTDQLTPNTQYVIGHTDALSFPVITPTGVLENPSTTGQFEITGYLQVSGTPGQLTINIQSLTGGTVFVLPGSFISLRKMA